VLACWLQIAVDVPETIQEGVEEVAGAAEGAQRRSSMGMQVRISYACCFWYK
jgi:hypothetical protein